MKVGSNSNLVIIVFTKRSLKFRCFQLAMEKTLSGWAAAACTSLTRTALSASTLIYKSRSFV